MAGVLDFKLGMSTAGFLGPLGGATAGLGKLLSVGGAVTSLFASITGLGAGVAGVFQQINEGGRLFDLSKRTSESVFNLASMEHAFSDVGVAASAVPAIIAQMQKSLGGVNEQGESTGKAFAQIGLNIEDLKKLNAPQQLAQIGAALAKLPKEEAIALASKIVSRGSAGDLLQIARSSEDFAAALEKAAPQAAILARNAAAFDKIGDTLGQIKLQVRGLFAGIAEGAAPGIQMLLDKINGIDFTSLGVKLGQVIGVLGQAIGSGQLTELLSLSLSAGFERGAKFLGSLFSNPDLYSGLGNGLIGVLAPFTKGLLSSAMLFNDAMAAGLTASLTGASFKDAFAAKRAITMAGMEKMFGTDEEFAASAFGFRKTGATDLRAALAKAALDSGGGEAEAKMKDLWDKLFASLPRNAEAAMNQNAGGGLFAPGTDKSKKGSNDVSAMERIGLVNFARDSGADYQRRAAIAAENQFAIAKQQKLALDKINESILLKARTFDVNS